MLNNFIEQTGRGGHNRRGKESQDYVGCKEFNTQGGHNILLERGRENLKTNVGNNQRLSIVDKGKEHNTQTEIAKDYQMRSVVCQ